jgi:hypothetical protein
MTAKKTDPVKTRKRPKVDAKKTESQSSAAGWVIIEVPAADMGIPTVEVLPGSKQGVVCASGFVDGGKVIAVHGVVLGANQRIPSVPPKSAIKARLIPGRLRGKPTCTFFEFAKDSRGRGGRCLPIHQLGTNNRLVVWANFKDRKESVLGNNCLQFDAKVRSLPTFGPDTDSHEVSSPLRGGLAVGGIVVLPQAKVVPGVGGGYLLDSCTVVKSPTSAAITGIRAKIYASPPTGPIDVNTLSAPFAEFKSPTAGSAVATYTFDASTQRIPGASLGKGNHLYVWATFASGTPFQLPVSGGIQFEGKP